MANSINRTIPSSGGITIKLYANKAQEAKARRLLDKMPNIYKEAFKRASRTFGTRLRDLVKRCLAIGQPPQGSGVSWAPHSQSTVHSLGAHTLLNYTGTYMNSIKFYQTPSRTWVGLSYNRQGGSRNRANKATAGTARSSQQNKSKLTLNQIAIILEFGNAKIPARPLWRPAWKTMGGNRKFQQELAKELRRELKKYM